MRLKHNILRVLIALLFFALFGILLQNDLLGEFTFSKQLDTPTVIPSANFVLDVPQKALWKNYVVVSAQATPGEGCVLLFIPPSGDSKEMTVVAGDDGYCRWRWKIEESYGKGDGRLIFTIGDKSETHFFEIRSSF